MRPEPLSTEPTDAPEPPEVIVVHEHRVVCDGGGGPLGHPRVYMEMGDSDYVECAYCDRRFVLAHDEVHDEDEAVDPAAYEGSHGR